MSDHGDYDYRFVCPECGESMPVNAGMRDALAARGCVVCASDVPAEAFDPL